MGRHRPSAQLLNGPHNELVAVVIDRDWWTTLTYSAPVGILPGTRVVVPVGNSHRVGIIVGPAGPYEGETKAIQSLLDKEPLLSPQLLALFTWLSQSHLCSLGEAMQALLPSAFRKGEEMTQPVFHSPPGEGQAVEYEYHAEDALRYERYRSMLADDVPTIVAFPRHETAKRFYASLAADPRLAGKKQPLRLLPTGEGKKVWRVWSEGYAAGGILVGSQNVAAAPLVGLGRIIIEDESNPIWRTMRRPFYNVRSLLSKRALLEGAQLVLGGRSPSARVWMKLSAQSRELPHSRRRVYFVNSYDAYRPQVEGVVDTLAVSEPLARETNRALDRDSWALWILDRKGYAGELICDECGTQLRCANCGGAKRWEKRHSRLRCVVCGARSEVPQLCPVCSGPLISARRPGLDALPLLAERAIGDDVPILYMDAEERKLPPEELSRPAGLVLGTRAAIELCDTLRVGLVAWLDPDGEARADVYDARARAFSLIWESCWRGREPQERRVLLQSRSAGRDWQKALNQGPAAFWRREIKERHELSLPPFMPLIRIRACKEQVLRIEKAIEGICEYWVDDEPTEKKKSTIWVRTKRMTALREALAPFFDIRSRVRPGVEIWYD